MWIHGLWAVPWVTLIVATALRWSEPELEEAALLDATYVQVFLHVTLRRAWPGVVAASVWILLVATSEIVVTDLYQVRTLAEELYTGFALANDPATTFGGFTAVVLTGALTGAALMILDGWLVAADHVPTRAPLVFRLGRWRWPVTLLASVVIVLLVVVPVGNLVYQVGLVVRQVDGVPVRSWSLGRSVELLVPLPSTYPFAALWEFRHAYLWTLAIGVASATLTVALAAPLAWTGRRGGLWALPAVIVAAAGAGTMGPLVGVVLIQVFTWSDQSWVVWLYDRTVLAPVLAATWRCLPMAVLICWFAFGGLTRVLLDAARVDGAGPIAPVCVGRRGPANLRVGRGVAGVPGDRMWRVVRHDPGGAARGDHDSHSSVWVAAFRRDESGRCRLPDQHPGVFSRWQSSFRRLSARMFRQWIAGD